MRQAMVGVVVVVVAAAARGGATGDVVVVARAVAAALGVALAVEGWGCRGLGEADA